MHTAFLTVGIVAPSRTVGNRNAQRSPKDQSASETPVVHEKPALSERLRVNRQEKEERESVARTETYGRVR